LAESNISCAGNHVAESKFAVQETIWKDHIFNVQVNILQSQIITVQFTIWQDEIFPVGLERVRYIFCSETFGTAK
jgi:hypothetical protein